MNDEKVKELKKADLILEINQVQSALNSSYNNLKLADNSHLLDYYAYKIKSEEALHQFLMEQFKNLDS